LWLRKSARWKAANREVNTILSLATAIETDWLRELVSDDIKSDFMSSSTRSRNAFWPPSCCAFAICAGGETHDPPPADAAGAFCSR